MRIGFTGTRRGMSRQQQGQLGRLLASLAHDPPLEFHHGAADGADTQAAALALAYRYRLHYHPAPGSVLPDGCRERHVLHEVLPPLVRNRRIVEACDILIAAPRANTEELRSGTWATIRYARKQGLPVVMLAREKEKVLL